MKCVSLLSAIWMVCIGFGYAEIETIYWTDEQCAVLDRSSQTPSAADCFTGSIDITRLAVDGDIFLTQIDLPEISYLNDANEVDLFLEMLEAEITICNGDEEDLWSDTVSIDPNAESTITFPPIQLLPYILYDIKIKLPHNLTYTFSGAYADNTFEIKPCLVDDESIKIDFENCNEFNANTDDVKDRKLSFGMVKCLHFNRYSTGYGIIYETN